MVQIAKKIYVYYNDDYDNVGGIGLESFTTKKDAKEWINSRLRARESNISDYRIIEGFELYPNMEIVGIN